MVSQNEFKKWSKKEQEALLFRDPKGIDIRLYRKLKKIYEKQHNI